MSKTEYAVYKGEDLLFIGTIEEVVAHFGVKRSTVYFWACPANHKRARLGRDFNRKRKYDKVKVAERITEEE